MTSLEFEICSINKSYRFGKKQVLNNVQLTAHAGECIGILGLNGCGKSTLLSILAGAASATSGSIRISKTKMKPGSDESKRYIGYVPQENPLIEELTAYDNLRLWYTDSQLNLEDELKNGSLSMLGIPDFLHRKVKHLSGGMKKRLNIGCALASVPRILLLDEPGASLDLICKEHIISYLRSYKEQGNILLLVTHEEQEIELCDRIFILKNGVLEEVHVEEKQDLYKNASAYLL